jgi:hypothetical protein
MSDRIADKIAGLLDTHKTAIIEELGVSAFDILPPKEVAIMVGVAGSRIPDLIREGWLEPAPGKDIGQAHQYYRWRVVFVQRFRKTRSRSRTNTISV